MRDDNFWDFAAFWEFFNPFEDEDKEENKVIECPSCRRQFDKDDKLEIVDKEDKIFKCPDCGTKLRFDSNLEGLVECEEVPKEELQPQKNHLNLKDKIEDLIESLESTDDKILNDAILSLVNIGAPAVKPLIQAWKIKAVHGGNVAPIHNILIKMGSCAVEDVILLLKDKNPEIRLWAAVYILKRIKDTRAKEPLIEMFKKDENEGVRQAALSALEEMGSIDLDLIIPATKEASSGIRAAVARFLGKSEDPKAIDPLIEFLKDKDSYVRSSAVRAWSYSKCLNDVRALEPIIAISKDESFVVREDAARALGKFNDPRATESLIGLLKDSDWQVREQAIWSLKMIKDKNATEPLLRIALEDKDFKIRGQAYRALGEIGDSSIIKDLRIAFEKEENVFVKGHISFALAKLEEIEGIRKVSRTVNYESKHGASNIGETARDKNLENKYIFTLSRYKGGIETSSEVFFEEIKKLFYEIVIFILKDNPGVLQRNLYKDGFDSSVFYWMARAGFIKREKSGNSFKLFISDKIPSKEESINSISLSSERAVIQIPVEAYPNSKERIIKYFGRDTLKKFFERSLEYQMGQNYNMRFGDLEDRFVSSGWQVIHDQNENEVYLYNRKEDNYHVNRFLASIGACLDLEMNEPLSEVINKYWTKECDEALRRCYSKYGFFSSLYFKNNELVKVLGERRLADFDAELEKKAQTFKIKWCGFHWDHIYSRHIIWDYTQYLRFKWGLKPELYERKCIYCNNSFYPLDPDFSSFSEVIQYYPINESIKEVNFCPKHFPPSSHGKFLLDESDEKSIKERMSILLKNLTNTLEFIPPIDFHYRLSYLKDISKEKFEEAIKIINDMPSFEKGSSTQPQGYKDMFGSWLKALDAAGVLEGGVRKTSRGYICLAKDGHECRSIGEKIIDDYLFTHNISHEQEPHYPGERQFRADWKVDKYFIEFWGLKGEEDYDIKSEEKRAIAQQYQIPLIEITFDDLRHLELKFKDIIV